MRAMIISLAMALLLSGCASSASSSGGQFYTGAYGGVTGGAAQGR